MKSDIYQHKGGIKMKNIESVIKKIEEVDYICRNVEYSHEDKCCLYFEAVDLANCSLDVRVGKNDGLMHENYGDGWEIIK